MSTPTNNDPLDWSTLAPHFTALLNEPLTAAQVPSWLERWSDLEKIIWEARAGLKRDKLWDETDVAAQEAYQRFVTEVFSPYKVVNQALKTKLLSLSDYVPAPEHLQMLRYLRAEAALFREENVPLQADIETRSDEYGAKTWSLQIQINGEDIPLPQAEERVIEQDRKAREETWRLTWTRWREERTFFDELFLDLLHKRHQLARNAGYTDYRAYRWQEMGRLDYTPTDCLALHDAIASEIVTLAATLLKKRCQNAGLASIRPWDRNALANIDGLPHPFVDTADFEQKMLQVYHSVDPELGALFERMRHGYLDLGARPGKPHGGEEWFFPITGLPYIRAYTLDTADDVSLLLHESGHAFHDALSLQRQGLFWNMGAPSEFSEFAAIAMTYLTAPYLEQQHGGFYTAEEASHMYYKDLEEVVVKWLPSIAMVDAFQHWIYTIPPEQLQPADLDAKWLELSIRFEPGIDWSGLEQERALSWQKVGMLFHTPFYQIEYALAHLGALQVWQKAQQDFMTTWFAYKQALSLGNTRSIPALYQAAGATLPFEQALLKHIVDFLKASLAHQ